MVADRSPASATRPAAVAGMFYPGEREALEREVGEMLARAATARVMPVPPKVLIVPHAGYVYSGPIAAQAYARLAALRGIVRRVVLLGPAHRVYLRGLALPASAAFATPLGEIPIDQPGAAIARALPHVKVSDDAHAPEHSLEVQLPFLQTVLGGFALVPLAVGDAEPEAVADVLDALWGGAETLIVISSDLSHYHPYREATLIDRGTAEAILALEVPIDHEQACGATPINGLLLCARRRRLEPELLDLRNSGDTAGERSRVVGYGAFAFSEPHPHGNS